MSSKVIHKVLVKNTHQSLNASLTAFGNINVTFINDPSMCVTKTEYISL